MANNYFSGRARASATSGRKSYLSTGDAVEEQLKKIDAAVNSTGKTIAQYCVQMSKSGSYDVKETKRELMEMIRGFSTEQQVEILATALTAMVVN